MDKVKEKEVRLCFRLEVCKELFREKYLIIKGIVYLYIFFCDYSLMLKK